MTRQALLIDDDIVDVETVRRAIRRNRMDVELTVAHDGVEGLEVLRRASTTPPIPILLDLNMPRMNGFEFLDVIRADPKLRLHQVFVLTTSKADVDLLRAYDRCVAGYIIKPLTFSKFCEAVQAIDGLWRVNELVPTTAVGAER